MAARDAALSVGLLFDAFSGTLVECPFARSTFIVCSVEWLNITAISTSSSPLPPHTIYHHGPISQNSIRLVTVWQRYCLHIQIIFDLSRLNSMRWQSYLTWLGRDDDINIWHLPRLWVERYISELTCTCPLSLDPSGVQKRQWGGKWGIQSKYDYLYLIWIKSLFHLFCLI